ncbi:flagellar FlbD family protein [Nocardioides perillae]|uniref:Flagellar protein FlbD n=1 Tax=Nocardioides perillae TaxID=1119534 RepID=A0A7Y9UNC8_9ACTN|nr:flagellar FlbD family protein [Nocardioides perillae]NYG57042.1 flagellar protein FlbD [Nocardioides perillae]
MITLTRLSGSVFALNSDLIERIDATPDTVISLVDGKKYVVAEGLEDVVELIRRHRGEIVARSAYVPVGVTADDEPAPPRLASVAALRPADARSCRGEA